MPSGFFFSLIAGILLAFPLHWMLTGLPRALEGAARLRTAGTGDGRAEDRIPSGAGTWALGGTALALFPAAWAAAWLLPAGSGSGGRSAILGLTVWAGFMATLMFFDTTARGSLIGSILARFKSPRWVREPQGTAISPERNDADPMAIAARVREEFRDRERFQGIRDILREFLEREGAREPDRFEIEREAGVLFGDEELKALAQRGELQQVERNRFREMLLSRGDITAEESDQWAEALFNRWNGLREAGAGPAEGGESGATEGRTAGTVSAAEPGGPGGAAGKRPEPAAGTAKDAGGAAQDIGAASGETVITVPSGFKERLQAFKEFLRGADRRELNPVRLEQEVETLASTAREAGVPAGPAGTAKEGQDARSIKRDDLVRILKQRRDISPQEADSIADLIDSARTRALSRTEMREHRLQETTDKAVARLRDGIYALKHPERDYRGFRRDLERVLGDRILDPAGTRAGKPERAGGIDRGSDPARILSDLQGLDRKALFDLFYAKRGVSKQDAERMAEAAEPAVESAREAAVRLQSETRDRVEAARRDAGKRVEAARSLDASATRWMLGITAAGAAAAALGGWLGARP